MGKISDIWVRLGLKKEGFDKGMNDAEKKAEGFGGTLNKVKAGALAVWAAVGAAVMKFAQDLIASTNRMGDAWATFTSQSKALWDTLMSSISSWNFDNFFARMREAAIEAANFAKAMDSEFEVGNSIKLQRAAMAGELAALKVQTQDATKSFDERIAAAQNYINKVTPLYEQIVAQAKRMEDAHLDKWLSGVGLGDNEQVRTDLRKFLVEIGKNADLYDQLLAYSNAQKTIDKGANFLGSNYGKINKAYDIRGRLADEIQGAQAGYNTDIIALFRAYNDMRGDKDTAPLVEAMVRAGEATSLKDRETQEMQSVMNGLINQRASAALNKAAKDAALLEDVLDWDMEDVLDVDLAFPEIDMSALDRADEKVKQFVKDWEEQQAEIAQLNGMLEASLVSAMGNGLQALTDLMFGLEGADASQVLAGILSPFADTMTQLGEMLIAEGIGINAFKESLKNLDPAIAIGAGVALLALGAALKSGIKSLAGGGAGAGTSSYTGGGSYGSNPDLNYESTLTVEVVGRLSGSDIVLAGQKTQNKWNR